MFRHIHKNFIHKIEIVRLTILKKTNFPNKFFIRVSRVNKCNNFFLVPGLMEFKVFNNTEHCFICNEYMNTCQNYLSGTTGYSSMRVYSIIGKNYFHVMLPLLTTVFLIRILHRVISIRKCFIRRCSLSKLHDKIQRIRSIYNEGITVKERAN